MEETSSQDHLNSSLTDLMTSLMVIFILLLLVFIQRTGAKDTTEATRLLKELQKALTPGSVDNPTIQQQQNRILVIAPERLMSFELGKYALSEKGKDFLAQKLPVIAATLYDDRFKDGIESIVVEGHCDRHVFPGLPPDISRNKNLELSQQRAMEVVKTALDGLKTKAQGEQEWFLKKLSASGRGQQECRENQPPEDCRKVIFVIRVRASEAKAIEELVK
jgi:outer membrane protein OmpA-like peptidoglycan-associated protein